MGTLGKAASQQIVERVTAQHSNAQSQPTEQIMFGYPEDEATLTPPRDFQDSASRELESSVSGEEARGEMATDASSDEDVQQDVTPQGSTEDYDWRRLEEQEAGKDELPLLEIGEGGVIQPEYYVVGEPFRIEMRGEYIFLIHERWSFTGFGHTLAEAEHNLIEDANLKARAFLEHPVTEMTQNALEMRDFVLKVIR